MNPLPPQDGPEGATAFYRDGQAMRSRSVSAVVLSGTVEVPPPTSRLLADWEREITQHLALEPGDVEPLPLARARMRWPDYGLCVQAAAAWTHTLSLHDLLTSSEVALMACRGARYHHDGAQYGGAAFCNLFLGEDRGQDLHFPLSGQRIPLRRGTVVLFDTGQPHGVIARRASSFAPGDFAPTADCSQVFLTWELPIAHPALTRALGIRFDTAQRSAEQLETEQVWHNGAPGEVCPSTGHWLAIAPQ
jgi:hypothetical protein